MHRARPHEEFWYLAGVGAVRRGEGIGSALLRHRLDRVRGPAYLESSKQENIALYERFGFELREAHQPARRSRPVADVAGRADRVKTLDWETIRLFLHVLAATVWVGGQITLAALVPALRGSRRGGHRGWPRGPSTGSPGRPSAVLVVTGIWNVVALDDTSSSFQNTLMLKYVLVLASGVTAYLHQRATSPRAMAVYGALTGAHRSRRAVRRRLARGVTGSSA